MPASNHDMSRHLHQAKLLPTPYRPVPYCAVALGRGLVKRYTSAGSVPSFWNPSLRAMAAEAGLSVSQLQATEKPRSRHWSITYPDTRVAYPLPRCVSPVDDRQQIAFLARVVDSLVL
jgi:hypothetical protein